MFAIDLHSRHFHPHFHFHMDRRVLAMLALTVAVGLLALIVLMPSKTSGRTSAAENVPVFVVASPIDPTFSP